MYVTMKLMGRTGISPVCIMAAQCHADCMWTDETMLGVSLFFPVHVFLVYSHAIPCFFQLILALALQQPHYRKESGNYFLI